MRRAIVLHDLNTNEPILIFTDKIDMIRPRTMVGNVTDKLYREKAYVMILVNGAVVHVSESYEDVISQIKEAINE